MSRSSAVPLERVFLTTATSRSARVHAPSPATHVAGIRFALPRTSPTTVRVVDVRGREVRVLLATELDPGEHRCSWDGLDAEGFRAQAGEYTLQLEVGGDVLTSRRVVIA